MNCKLPHRYDEKFSSLPYDQGGEGRHKCAGCAYDRGFALGKKMQTIIQLSLDSLPDSQAREIRHKSPHAAFAQGYLDGVKNYYKTLSPNNNRNSKQ